jgi:DDE superfamily endonuclease
VQSLSSLVINSEFVSNYKGRTTLKCLVGVTPSGAVSFINSLYPGSISDKQINRVSGFLNLLEEGDLVMADKGFLIQDLLVPKNCTLVMPNFLAQNVQFSAAEAEHNKVIANLRVLIEGDLKCTTCLIPPFHRILPDL